MTSSAFICELGVSARIKKLKDASRKHLSSRKHSLDKTKPIHYSYGYIPICKKASPCFQKKFFQKEFFQKKQMGGNSVRVWIKTASSAAINTCLFYWICVYGGSVKCLFSSCPVFSLFFCLAVNNCIGNIFYIFLNSCMWLEVFLTNQTAGLKNSILMKQAISNMYLDIIMWLDILRANKLIKCVCLVMVRHSQLCLNQSDSKIIEILATQDRF